MEERDLVQEMLDPNKKKWIDEALEAGFSQSQAEFLHKKIINASLGFGMF